MDGWMNIYVTENYNMISSGLLPNSLQLGNCSIVIHAVNTTRETHESLLSIVEASQSPELPALFVLNGPLDYRKELIQPLLRNNYFIWTTWYH